MLIHVKLQLPVARAQTKTSYFYFTSWYNNIFGYKLRTDKEKLRLKILKKLRAASLKSSGVTRSLNQGEASLAKGAQV